MLAVIYTLIRVECRSRGETTPWKAYLGRVILNDNLCNWYTCIGIRIIQEKEASIVPNRNPYDQLTKFPIEDNSGEDFMNMILCLLPLNQWLFPMVSMCVYNYGLRDV